MALEESKEGRSNARRRGERDVWMKVLFLTVIYGSLSRMLNGSVWEMHVACVKARGNKEERGSDMKQCCQGVW